MVKSLSSESEGDRLFECPIDLPYSYNNVKALDQQGIEIRTSDGVNIGGFYLSSV